MDYYQSYQLPPLALKNYLATAASDKKILACYFQHSCFVRSSWKVLQESKNKQKELTLPLSV
jgi:hypothetical protein